MTTEHSWIQMHFNNDVTFIDTAQDVTQKLLQTRHVVEDELFWISLAVREAVINAMKHGNKFAPEKQVGVEVEITGRHLRIRITDQGCGFDPESVPNPLEEQNLLKPSGRGIFYMRSFMNQVVFEKAPGGGTQVVLEKNLLINESLVQAEAENPASSVIPEASV